MLFSRVTLYLLILTGFFALILFSPIAVEVNPTNAQEVKISVHQFFITQVLSLILLILSITALLIFKKRKFQSRLTIFIMVICVALQIIFPILLQLYCKETGILRYEIVFVTPLIAALLAYLTFRRITQDEIIEKIIEFKKFDKSKE